MHTSKTVSGIVLYIEDVFSFGFIYILVFNNFDFLHNSIIFSKRYKIFCSLYKSINLSSKVMIWINLTKLIRQYIIPNEIFFSTLIWVFNNSSMINNILINSNLILFWTLEYIIKGFSPWFSLSFSSCFFIIILLILLLFSSSLFIIFFNNIKINSNKSS